MATKVILDTDIGTDIDDAVCLAYLLAQPECDLIGITTVTGEPLKRAQMASAQCRVAGVEVPIHVGCDTPLLVKQIPVNSKQVLQLYFAMMSVAQEHIVFDPNFKIPRT